MQQIDFWVSELDRDSKMNDTIQIPSFMNAWCKIQVCKEKVGISHYNLCVIESLFKTRLIEYKTFKDKTLITQIHSSYFEGAKIELPNLQNYQEKEESQELRIFFAPDSHSPVRIF